MHKPIKYVEKAVAVTANVAWQVFERLNQISQNPSFTPKWSDAEDRFLVPQVRTRAAQRSDGR
jgi:hypothetical protein